MEIFILAFIWLAFIPNSFYIITDLFYLEERPEMPFWFDLALLLSFVWNGVILGVLSVRHMEKIFERRFGLKREWLFIIPVMGLNALGIFTGRYLRYNSWDILSNPFELASDLTYLIAHPLRNRIDWSMILCYALLMMVIYSSLKRLGRAIS